MSAQKFSPAFFKRRRRSNARSVGRLRRGETPFAAFLFCQAFFFGPLVSKKKADIKFVFALLYKGNPPLVRFPSAEPRLGIHPSVALWKDKGISLVATSDQRSARWIGGRFLKKAT